MLRQQRRQQAGGWGRSQASPTPACRSSPHAIGRRPAPLQAQAGGKGGGVGAAVPRHIAAVQPPKGHIGGVAAARGSDGAGGVS